MINALPVIGWVLSLFFNVSLAIPFWIFYSKMGIGVKYFYFLPEVYRYIGFWDSVMLFICAGIIKSVFLPSFSSTYSSKS